MSERSLRLIVIVLAVLAHVIAFFQFHFQASVINLSVEQEQLLTWLLGLSLLIVFILPLSTNHRLFWFLVLIRSIFIVVLGRVLGDYFGVEMTLLAGLVLEICIYTLFRIGLWYATGMLLVALLFQLPITDFGSNLPVYSWHEYLAFSFYFLLVAAVTLLLRFQRENQVSVNELNRRLNESTLALAKTNMKLQEYAISAEQEAMQNERKRLAREIHDTLGYTLTNLMMMMEVAIDRSRGDSVLVSHLEKARNQAKDGLIEVKQALNALRPVQLTDLNGLLAIHRLVKAFEEATQIKVELQTSDAPLCFGSDECNLTVFRLVQEGITNALRHGQATQILISLGKFKNGLNITIRDNGQGCGGNALVMGYGLAGMRERIERLGGYLEITDKSQEGFVLNAWIPLIEE